jgi:hypothetical protein
MHLRILPQSLILTFFILFIIIIIIIIACPHGKHPTPHLPGSGPNTHRMTLPGLLRELPSARPIPPCPRAVPALPETRGYTSPVPSTVREELLWGSAQNFPGCRGGPPAADSDDPCAPLQPSPDEHHSLPASFLGPAEVVATFLTTSQHPTTE